MATPAPPVLASDIYVPQPNDTESNDATEPSPQRQKLNTDIKAIDQALEGGFDFGVMHCITAEPDHDAKELLQTLLVSHLCSTTNAAATVVDSALSFDLLGLYRALESSLTTANEEAKPMLERLKIMKVFDCIGLTEALSELREDLERESIAGEHVQQKPFPKSTIEDSEDEDDMLDVPSPKGQPPALQPQKVVKQPARRLLVINDISKVVSPLIKNNYASGQAVMASLMRSLRHITTQNDLCTVLFSNASNKPATEDDTSSLFGSCTIRPSLGPTFGHLVDVQLYLHQIPARRITEAERAGKAVEMVNILEVIQDTAGLRYGRWAPFVCRPDGRVADVS